MVKAAYWPGGPLARGDVAWKRCSRWRRAQGFTLVEVMVALLIVSMMAGMSWLGVDSLLRSQSATAQQHRMHAQLQISLQQWSADLNQSLDVPQLKALDWDGKAFRITRRAAEPAVGVVVTAWAVRAAANDAGLQWMRWQSPPLLTHAQWQSAWQAAANWARGSDGMAGSSAVALLAAQNMDLFFWAQGAWVNAQSSASSADTSPSLGRAQAVTPRGVRMQLHMAAGVLTKDWVSPVGAPS